MNIINLLTHDVTVLPPYSDRPVVFPSEGKLQVRMSVDNVTPSGIIKRGHWTYTRGLPEPQEDTIYIVSSLVAMFELYENNRQDLVFPWGMSRGRDGRVMSCNALCRPERRTK